MFPPPAGTVAGAAGDAAFVTVRSFVTAAASWVTVVWFDVLLVVGLSAGVLATDAVFWNVMVLVVVFAGTVATIVTVAEVAPAARVPTLQVTVCAAAEQLADEPVAVNVCPAASTSVTTTAFAAVFPVWLTVTV